MKGKIFKPSINRDVCIFCTTRIQFASTLPPSHSQQRSFRSTTTARNPPAAAAQQEEDENNIDEKTSWNSPAPKAPLKWGTGWARSTKPTALTPEEEALRASMVSQPQPSPAEQRPTGPSSPNIQYTRLSHRDSVNPFRNAPAAETKPPPLWHVPQGSHASREKGSGRNRRDVVRSQTIKPPPGPAKAKGNSFTVNGVTWSVRPDWRCAGCGWLNWRLKEECRKCHVARPSLGEWLCPTCNSTNDGSASECQKCHPPERRRTALKDRNGTYFRKMKTEVFADTPSRNPPSFRHHDLETNSEPNAAEEEKDKRMRRAAAGSFVPFNKQLEDAHMRDKNIGTADGLPSPGKYSKWSDWVLPSAPNHPPIGSLHQDQTRYKQQSPPLENLSSSTERERLQRPDIVPDRLVTVDIDTRGSGEEPHRQSFKPISLDQEGEPYQEVSITRDALVARERQPDLTGSISTPAPGGRTRHKARRGNTYIEAFDGLDPEEESAAKKRERKEQRKKAKMAQQQASAPIPISLPEFISVSNLASVLRVRVEDFLQKMQALGFEELSNDHILDAETAGLIAAEFNFEPVVDNRKEQDIQSRPPPVDKSLLPSRPPVVTIMGHVDHGKTTLLDYLRKSSVAASEHGGITQHIGAFSVRMPGGRLVTFLDTPGHAAFLSMRQRGANVTDIVILVVAADDSVKPQTIEAIKHAQAAKVPIIVAINKVDKEDANIERTKQDLARYGVEIEDFGGETQAVCVSGKTGHGMKELEDATVALADILDMRAEIDGPAEGWVLEATTKKAGRVATVLVRRGTLRPSDIIVAGTSWARVRSLRNEAGVAVRAATPGTPVEIDGWREQPSAGDKMLQAPDEQRAKAAIEYRLEAYQREQMAADMVAVNESRRLEQEKREQLESAARLAALAKEDPEAAAAATANIASSSSATPVANVPAPNKQEVFFILKADVSGSVEAVTDAVSALGTPEIRPHILRSGVGPITEFDVEHAAAAQGHIINFNTPVDGAMSRMAESKGVKVLDQSIIYRLVDDVKAEIEKRAPEVVTQKVVGEAEISKVFEINTKGRVRVPVAGCKVRNGVVVKGGKVRVLRGKEVVYDGSLSSLKSLKKDVLEMRKGTECGIGFENWTGFQEGDQVQCYEETVEKRGL